MKYQGIEICKREGEVISFLQTGSNNFWNAYYNYHSRKLRGNRPTLTICSWFNYTIKTLHQKKLFLNVHFVLKFGSYNFSWINPGVNASRANFQALTLHDTQMKMKAEIKKII